jgi:serine/threonine protein kinase
MAGEVAPARAEPTWDAVTVGDWTFDARAVIGCGTFGLVYLGRSARNGSIAAVKAVDIRPDYCGEEAMPSFVRGVKLAKALPPHANLVRVLYSDIADCNPFGYVITEHCGGGDLRALLDREGRLPEERALLYTNDLAEGLACLHRHRLIHRDIKPTNLLFGSAGARGGFVLRISDFGRLCPAAPTNYTRCGAPCYMAPEVARGGGYSCSADWWSAGVVLYEMLAGKLPFEAFPRNKSRESFERPAGITDACQGLLEALLKVDKDERRLFGHPLVRASGALP